MASEVEICNFALSQIGIGQAIASRDEGGVADACDLWFDQCRDMMLRAVDWSFARRYRTLSLVEEEPNTLWAYSYRYPANALAIRRLAGISRLDPTRYPFDLGGDGSGRLIYADIADAVAIYTERVEDTEMFDALATHALAMLLASKIAKPLARGDGELKEALGLYGAAINAAINASLNESQRDEEPDAAAIRARG